jgi:hypothetical protein
LIPSPIRKVLSSMRTNGVQSLLMGGQACVLYGAAEFSRDTDLAVLANAENLSRLALALEELHAEPIAVPPFEARYLEMGLAIHFRCGHAGCAGMRIDVMSKMRGVAPFEEIWARRTTLESDDGPIDTLSLPDLVQAKKTQRDKDWPMLSRLVESNYFSNRDSPTPEQITFWAKESRTPQLLIAVASEHPSEIESLSAFRPLLALTLQGGAAPTTALKKALQDEERLEREADRGYWIPLRQELERLRARSRSSNADRSP